MQNFLVSQNWTLKLADFGSAALGQRGVNSLTSEQRLALARRLQGSRNAASGGLASALLNGASGAGAQATVRVDDTLEGTPQYFAPELVLARGPIKYRPSCDIYAWGM